MKINQIKYSFILGLIAVIVYNLNYIILGEDSYINILDTLDDLVPKFKMIKDSGEFFNQDAIMPVADGFKRSLFNSPYDPTSWLFMLFPTYWAIIVQIYICKIVAYISMFCLLKESFRDIDKTSIPAFVSFGFSLIPFNYIYGLGVAATPLAALSFLWLYRDQKFVMSYLLLAFYGVYTYFPLVGFFTCVLAGLGWLLIYVYEKHLKWHMLIGLGVLSLAYIICNWSLFQGYFYSDEVYHRVEFFSDMSIIEIVRKVTDYFLIGQMHIGKFFPALAVIIILLYGIKSKFKDIVLNWLLWGFLFIGIIAFISNLLKSYIPIFNAFKFDRFYFFVPILCFFAFGYLLYYKRGLLNRVVLISSFVLLVMSCRFFDNEHKYAVMKLLNIDITDNSRVSFSNFYDTKLFSQIKNENLLDDRHKACAIGFHPNILMYNGIPSVDFYHNLYPLAYKHRFRKVIAKELAKDSDLADYFDNWGNRCYVFSSELGKSYLFGKYNEIREINSLEIDTQALKDLGCSYIISAVKINNADLIKIDYINTYTTSNSFWEMHVYRL